MELVLGKKLAGKYTEISKKNRECSMFGFISEEEPGEFSLKDKLEKFCIEL